ncbi:hypothetical protein DCAR_0415887 [Daucus carota subsp. sativus]|uniref:Uncharacterized protein n=1 Tax=Daucus carota subsp. sativus TaxID=79200 RepID=A0A165WV81_DAUCS|nr:hypothetical protein DCAR_0415887 [Daucus carota subsp. sativus]
MARLRFIIVLVLIAIANTNITEARNVKLEKTKVTVTQQDPLKFHFLVPPTEPGVPPTEPNHHLSKFHFPLPPAAPGYPPDKISGLFVSATSDDTMPKCLPSKCVLPDPPSARN